MGLDQYIYKVTELDFTSKEEIDQSSNESK